MNDFVEQCRREWKRLRVPDQVADEMAADLAADLKEAEAEGASVEDVLGSGASDPRSFAASWAAERAVIPPPRMRDRVPRTALVLSAIAALTLVAALGAALVIFASPDVQTPAAALGVPEVLSDSNAPPELRVVRQDPLPPALVSPDGAISVWIQPDGRGILLSELDDSGVEINKIGSILLIVGLVGILPAMLFLFWSSRPRRDYSF